MEFTHEFVVAGQPPEVIEHFSDVAAMTALLPGASVGERQEDGSYPATLVVSFGPKRIAFKGSVTHAADPAELCGRIAGRASADIRGARMAVSMVYQLSEAPGATVPSTLVRLVSEAELSGVLGEFAKTGGAVVVEAMLAEFARRFSAEFTPKTALPADPAMPAPAAASRVAPAVSAHTPARSPAGGVPNPPALSAGGLAFAVLRQTLRNLGRSLSRLFGAGSPKA